MTHIAVKPAPTLDKAAWPLLKHPVSGGLLDASGEVPADGRPWLNDGFTARMLTDGAILRAEDPVFAALAAKAEAERGDAAPEADRPAADHDPAH